MVNDGNIPVLAHAIRLMTAIAEDRALRNASELGRSLGIAQATNYRIIRTLENADWLARRAEGGYEISTGLLRLTESAEPARKLLAVAEDEMTRLSNASALTTKLSIRNGDYAVTALRRDPPEVMAVGGTLGGQFHLCYGSSGAMFAADFRQDQLARLIESAPAQVWTYQSREDFLARVDQVRQTASCVDHGSYHPNIHSISAPIRNDTGRILAVLSVLALPHDLPAHRIAELRRQVVQSAQACEGKLHAPQSAPLPAAQPTEGKP